MGLPPLPSPLRRALAATALLALAAAPAGAKLSPLADKPDWSQLDVYQKTITKDEFKLIVDQVYAPDGVFWRYAKLGDDSVTVYSDSGKSEKLWTLQFAPGSSSQKKRPQLYAPNKKIGKDGKPLAGMTVVLDPGHIGGEFAQQEERFFQIGDDNPIKEGDMVSITCDHIKAKLEKLGATVHVTHELGKPVTKERPETLKDEAKEAYTIWTGRSASGVSDAKLERIARDLFNRTAEINARAALIEEWKPDLTVCVHYNAAPWGSKGQPRMTAKSRLVNFVHGAYSARELEYDDQKFFMLRNVLDQIYPHEVAVADTIAQNTGKAFNMGPEVYKGWKAVQRVGPNPYVYARNLVANRVFRGPVVFVEGPYMNAKDAYYWMEAGDYDGKKTIRNRNGKTESIMRVFSDAIVDGIVDYVQGDLYQSTKARIEKKS